MGRAKQSTEKQISMQQEEVQLILQLLSLIM